MAKKAQKMKKGKRSELLIVNPNAAGIFVDYFCFIVCSFDNLIWHVIQHPQFGEEPLPVEIAQVEA